MGIELKRLLRAAKDAWDHRGCIPADIAAKLMALGVIVPDLEIQWSHA